MNFVLDLLHEDLNLITKKPYIEMINRPTLDDHLVAGENWDNFLARNQSVIIDLMFGQLKSTVTCSKCSTVFRTFDPYMTI